MTQHPDPGAPDAAVPHPDIGGYALGGLEPHERAAFEAVLAGDPGLRRQADELAEVTRLLGLAALVDGDGLDDVAVPALAPMAAPRLADAPGRSTPPAAATAGRSGRRPLLGLAAAAAVAVAIGVSGGVLATRQRSPRPERELALALPAGSAAPGARGTAALYRQADGVGVRLRMSGLAPTGPGARYECWWVGGNGRVGAGSFQVGASGVADVRLTVAAALDGPFKLNVNRVAGGVETTVLTASVA